MVHAPILAAGPETRLAGVWARRPEAAQELAQKHGAPAFESLEELLERCAAVAFAVAPAAQPELATRAARRGKALLLEKPLALSLDEARRLVDAVGESGVGSVVVLTLRFIPAVRSFLERARGFGATGGRAWMFSGAHLAGPFASSPWRQERGALLDIGPHVLDLIDAALGATVEVRARAANSGGWVSLWLEHENGAVSDVSLSCRSALDPGRLGAEVYGEAGAVALDGRATAAGVDAGLATLRAEFAEVARTGKTTGKTSKGHECDARRALHLQEVIARAEAQLSG